jgi:hypothetical protein
VVPLRAGEEALGGTGKSGGRTPTDVNIPKIVAAGAVAVRAWREDEPVEVRYSLPDDNLHDRSSWPWLPGTVVTVCGLDEWQVCVEVSELATLEDGRPARQNTPDHKLFYPLCFRDSSEIRARAVSDKPNGGTR